MRWLGEGEGEEGEVEPKWSVSHTRTIEAIGRVPGSYRIGTRSIKSRYQEVSPNHILLAHKY